MIRQLCPRCGASVLRAQTPSGSWVTLDAEPSEYGTYTLGYDELARFEPHSLAPRHRQHTATCPDQE